MSFLGLLRTEAQLWRAEKTVRPTGEVALNWTHVASVRCSLRRSRGGLVRGPAGETLAADFVAYLPPGVDIRPEFAGQTPDKLRIEGRDYLCVFVDRGPSRSSPIKVGLKHLEG